MDKRSLSERDICTKFITPALRQAGWDEMLQIREEVGFTPSGIKPKRQSNATARLLPARRLRRSPSRRIVAGRSSGQ